MLRSIRNSQRLRLQTVTILTIMVILMVIWLLTPFLRRMERSVEDMMLGWQVRTPDQDLVLLSIDEESLNLTAPFPEEIEASRALTLMKKGFPWSREVYALVADQLLRAGARMVIFDMVYPRPGEGDEIFAETLKQSDGRIVIGWNFDRMDSPQGTSNWLSVPPTGRLAEAAPGQTGYVNLNTGHDLVVRSFYPYATAETFQRGEFGADDAPKPALTTAAARQLGFRLPEVNPVALRFPLSRPGAIPSFSLYQIFIPDIWKQTFRDGEYFRDKIVLIGGTATIMQDRHRTPVGAMAGPEIQLNVLSALRHGSWVHSLPPWVSLIGQLLAGVAVIILSINRRSVVHFILGCVGVAGVATLVGLIVFIGLGWFIPLAVPLTTFFFCGFGALAVDVALERRERGQLRHTLERYVSKDVVREIVDNPASFLQTLGGERKEIVILFSDLKGFTSDSEALDPAHLVAELNAYFTEMVDAVFSHKGTLDKFMGDALMATWGCVRESTPSADALAALETAFEMRDRLQKLNATRGSRWESGTAICQGLAVFGNIGSQQKMDPTVIGDTVNLTSRLEGLTRIYGCGILLNERLADQVRSTFPVLLVDVVKVRGRRTTERLFHPVRSAAEAEWFSAFTTARDLYLARDFAAAGRMFADLSHLPAAAGLAHCYQKRCADFLQHPPAPDWDGVWEFLTK